MKDIRDVKVQVKEPPNPFGEFANAFRFSLDGNEVLIDFVLYSESNNEAMVVSRVRAPQELLFVIQQKISKGLLTLRASDIEECS